MATVNPLNTALAGLRAAQAQLSVTSANISNVSTEGYTRKTISQYSTVTDGQGTGPGLGIIQRRVNDILTRDYRAQTSLTTALETRATYLNQIQEFHGPPDTEQSITAEIGKLKDAFTQLANQPESTLLQNTVYASAQRTVQKFQDFSNRITEMRNNIQTEMKQSITTINALTTQIANLNEAIKSALGQNRSSAELEDQRDLAVRNLSKEVDLSYYRETSGVLVVMTRKGQLLADTASVPIAFNPAQIGPTSYYPASAATVRLGNSVTGTDLTAEETLGGRLGELINLRDTTLPTYNAQLDELAHKMATRFAEEGLKLFTMPDGTIPANTPASYVGFANDMVINPEVASNRNLLRIGTTTGSTVQDGSAEVLRKIVQFAFGDIAYQRGLGTVDISNAVPTLFTTLGITGQARVTGDKNIVTLGSLDSSPVINPGTNDTFTIQVGAGAAQTITITASMTAAGLRTAINAVYPGMAQLGTGGELILTANDTLTIGGGTLGAGGLEELGLDIGVVAADPPYFTIAIGNEEPTTIQILSTDTSTELLAKLNAIAGVDATLTPDGYLQIQPDEGGDLTLIDGLNAPLAALGVTVSDVPHAAFNTSGLGPGSNLNSGVQGSKTLLDFSSQMVSTQSQDAETNDVSLRTESNYFTTLEKQVMDTTAVNLDEEMALLINIQTAYNASARTIGVAQQMLDDLLNTLR